MRMSRNTTPDPQMERCIQQDVNHPDTLLEQTVTPVERPLTATQAKNQRLTSQEPLEDIRKSLGDKGVVDGASTPEPPHSDTLDPLLTSQKEISNLELHTTLLDLSRNNQPYPKKKHQAVREPDLFSSSSPDELQAFLFQCQIYFRASEGEFTEDSEKIFFAISYLRGIALDYFEPFITEPDPSYSLDFLEDWSAFVQRLSNIFGPYSPKDNDEDALVTILFSHDGKATDYFIHFAEYQNWIHWDDRSLVKW